ncbi:unnamed protein product [Paramecium sonneborni]|uniref:Uncharacterized protein n=1 Tax=Paramecium sonneborni TaxID=65129 RepID=A0A8S1RII3_9CILI|nr:unnamed protein product [Paramecium sonneborni]
MKIVGVTLTGFAKYAEIFKRIDFNTLVVEEAGEVLESNLIAVLSKQINHLILIGDHQQLKPHMECYDLEVKFRAIERLIKNGLEYATFKYQRRMKSKFADFIRLIYQDYQDHTSIQEQNKIEIEGIKTDLVFFNHRHKEDEKLLSSSKSNKFEAKMILRMVEYLLTNGYKGEQITVLTTYLKQAQYIKNNVNKMQEYSQQIIIKEKKMIQYYYLQLDRTLIINQVLLQQIIEARLGLYIFGNFGFIEECIKDHLIKQHQQRNPDISDLWLRIIDLARQKGVIQNYIELKYHNIDTKIYEEKDWDQVKGCGCTYICNTQLCFDSIQYQTI